MSRLLTLVLAGRILASAGWTDVTKVAGLAAFRNPQGSPAKDYIVESIGGGCAWIDYDRDGRLDALLVRGSTLTRLKQGGDPVIALYRNRGGGAFEDVTVKAGLVARGWGMGVAVADYDNDGWPDFVVTGLTRSYLFHNEGNGAFTERAVAAGVARQGVWSAGAAFGDIDMDGKLDLYVAGYVDVNPAALPSRGSSAACIYKDAAVFCGPRGMKPAADALFHNQGTAFRDVSRESGIAAESPAMFGLQPLIADFDGDGRPDIFVANDSTPNYLFRNEGHLRFREVGIGAGVAVNMDGRAQASMGADFADYDGDGLPDLALTNFSEDTNTLYRNLGQGLFEDASWTSKFGPPSWLLLGWGVKLFDYDLDGRLDIVVANGHVYPEADRFRGGSSYGQRLLLHRSLGGGRFGEIGSADNVLRVPMNARGLATGDFDNDGDLDLLINNQDGPPRLLRNDRSPDTHWLEVALTGSISNRDGVGAVVTVHRASGRSTAVRLAGDSYLSSSDPRLHFGLGTSGEPAAVEVRWPAGRVQTAASVHPDQVIRMEEPGTGR